MGYGEGMLKWLKQKSSAWDGLICRRLLTFLDRPTDWSHEQLAVEATFPNEIERARRCGLVRLEPSGEELFYVLTKTGRAILSE